MMFSTNSPPRAVSLSFGAGLWMFGQFVDRYATDAYGPPVGTLQAIARAGEVGLLSAVDINYPFEPGVTPAQVKSALQDAGLRAIAVTPAIYTRKFQRGSFTNPDSKLRGDAIDLCKRAIDVAQLLEADYVKFWPGQDGYDYPFQAEYTQLWDLAVAGVRSLAASHPQMGFAIEYKSKEPRTHITFSSAARTLLAIQDMGVDNVGIVMDLGHSLFAQETPAEELQLIARRGKLRSVEVNDNWRQWDDDLTVGAVHLIETLEFMLALRSIGWQRPILLDQFPFREDPVVAARHSIGMLKLLDAALDRIDLAQLHEVRTNQDALAAQRLVYQTILGDLR
ncbi:sugar phosphate isomerase/epimerase family protein [Steroidobacter agaridevorans]|uniref:sugar phosphate isomerase/epimerase family protein n=1 Tax=Steroidobacter agaridevorans TaxID=2695856 RepID=UPI00192A2E1F|nr:sugar phosphate isomerase/epimerase [Steroidobacter agaridevorans]